MWAEQCILTNRLGSCVQIINDFKVQSHIKCTNMLPTNNKGMKAYYSKSASRANIAVVILQDKSKKSGAFSMQNLLC